MVTDFDKQIYDDLEKQKEELGLYMDSSEYKGDRAIQRTILQKFCVLCEEQQKIIPYPYIKRQKYLAIVKLLKKSDKIQEAVSKGLIDIEKAKNKFTNLFKKTLKQKNTKGGFRNGK